MISTKRKDALPRTGSLSAGPRKPGRKKATSAAGRASAKLDELTAMEIAQALAALEPVMVTALEPVADTVAAVERPATAYEEFAVTALKATEVEALAVVETELEVDASAIVEEFIESLTAPSTAVGPPPIPEETRARPLARTTAQSLTPAPPAPHDERRSFRPDISRLLSTLSRWTGVSGTK